MNKIFPWQSPANSHTIMTKFGSLFGESLYECVVYMLFAVLFIRKYVCLYECVCLCVAPCFCPGPAVRPCLNDALLVTPGIFTEIPEWNFCAVSAVSSVRATYLIPSCKYG